MEQEPDFEATRMSFRMYDEDEMPNDLTNPIILHKVKEHVPSHMQDMMKYLPQELQNTFKTLLTPTKQMRQEEVPMPNHKITRKMTQKQCVVALAVKAMRLKVGEALKSSHSHEWKKAMITEVNSLLHVFKCLVPEEIDFNKDYDCIHAAVDLKIKYIDENTIDKFKVRICSCGNELV